MWSGDPDGRPRERLLRRGPRDLTDVELLAVVLRNGHSGQSAVDLAGTVLRLHRDVPALARVRADVLAGVAGMGPAKAASIAAAVELGRRTVELAEALPLRRPADVVAAVRRDQAVADREELLVLVADVGNRLRWTVPVAAGPLTTPGVAVRLVVDTTVAYGGAAVAVARRCPGPGAEATALDEEVVRRLRPAATYAGLRLLDYVVVGDVEWAGVVGRLRYSPPGPPQLPPRPDPPPVPGRGPEPAAHPASGTAARLREGGRPT
jgi:DNA repair protein RadC